MGEYAFIPLQAPWFLWREIAAVAALALYRYQDSEQRQEATLYLAEPIRNAFGL